MDKTKFTANPHLDSEGFSSDCEAPRAGRQALVKGIWPWLQPNMSHVQIKRDLVERRHRARAANEPGIKVFGYEAFNNAGAHIGKTYEVSALPTKVERYDWPTPPVPDVKCEGCTPQACTWADLSDEEIEAQHRHWQTMGNGWSGA